MADVDLMPYSNSIIWLVAVLHVKLTFYIDGWLYFSNSISSNSSRNFLALQIKFDNKYSGVYDNFYQPRAAWSGGGSRPSSSSFLGTNYS